MFNRAEQQVDAQDLVKILDEIRDWKMAAGEEVVYNAL
mgnify:CR=1 FL=1